MRTVENCKSLSSLLGLAIMDVKKTVKEGIGLNMDAYIDHRLPYRDRSDICSVCLAGAVIINHDIYSSPYSSFFPEVGSPFRKALLALDSLRFGNIIMAVEHFYGLEDYGKINRAMKMQHSWDPLRLITGQVSDVDEFIVYLEEMKSELKKRKL